MKIAAISKLVNDERGMAVGNNASRQCCRSVAIEPVYLRKNGLPGNACA